MESSGLLSSIAKFVSENPLIVIFVFTLSLLANIIQVISYFNQKRLEGAYDDAFKTWERNLKGKYTNAQIQELRKEMALLQNKIVKDIPKQAKRVFLEDQLNSISDNISQSYMRYNQLMDELRNNVRNTPLPESLQQAIEQNIMPSYLDRQRKQEFIYWGMPASLTLTTLPITFLIIRSRFFDGVHILALRYLEGRIWQIAFSIITITFLFYRLYGKNTRFQNPQIIAVASWWFFSIVFFGLVFLIPSPEIYFRYSPSDLFALLIFILASAPVAFSIFLSLKCIGNALRARVQKRQY